MNSTFQKHKSNILTVEKTLNWYNPIITLPSPPEVAQWGMPPKVTVRKGVPLEVPEITLYENIKHICLFLTGRRSGDNNRPAVEDP